MKTEGHVNYEGRCALVERQDVTVYTVDGNLNRGDANAVQKREEKVQYSNLLFSF
jgi:hypothetical protein